MFSFSGLVTFLVLPFSSLVTFLMLPFGSLVTFLVLLFGSLIMIHRQWVYGQQYQWRPQLPRWRGWIQGGRIVDQMILTELVKGMTLGFEDLGRSDFLVQWMVKHDMRAQQNDLLGYQKTELLEELQESGAAGKELPPCRDGKWLEWAGGIIDGAAGKELPPCRDGK
ncbi:hypothetical protein HD554DRAFT_2038722 [Boletus coccyginus]|nr:hypothetical protein HD554DRAFT_2038722 [Boletus coccyginus]